MAHSISEAKFALQDLLMNHLGLSAAAHVDALDAAQDKAALALAVSRVLGALEASKKPAVAKALSASWAGLRIRL